MSDNIIHQVAEAIWRAGYPRESANRTWRDLVNKAHYLAMARAAIDALQPLLRVEGER